jgi:hypothetical protein
MNLRDKAIGGAAVVEFCIRQIERELADGRREAEAEGLATTVDLIDVAQVKVRKAHRALEALRAQLSASVQSPDESRSGGDDKPEEDPEGPN